MTGAPAALEASLLIDDSQRRALEESGFVRLRGALDPETLRHYEPAVTERVIELNTMHLPMAERSTYNKAFLQVMNLWTHSEAVQELVCSRRLAQAAADLLGVRGVRLYHDQALYKEPGGGFTPWHADQYYWPFESDRTITVWIPLQDTPSEMGPLEFAAGSHRLEFGRDLGISDESERELQSALDAGGYPTDSTPYALGDVSYHLGWTFHRAGPNTAAAPRRVMTVIYIDADITVSAEPLPGQRPDLETWLPGALPGRTPDSPLNPVLYRC